MTTMVDRRTPGVIVIALIGTVSAKGLHDLVSALAHFEEKKIIFDCEGIHQMDNLCAFELAAGCFKLQRRDFQVKIIALSEQNKNLLQQFRFAESRFGMHENKEEAIASFA